MFWSLDFPWKSLMWSTVFAFPKCLNLKWFLTFQCIDTKRKKTLFWYFPFIICLISNNWEKCIWNTHLIDFLKMPIFFISNFFFYLSNKPFYSFDTLNIFTEQYVHISYITFIKTFPEFWLFIFTKFVIKKMFLYFNQSAVIFILFTFGLLLKIRGVPD